MRLQAPMRFSNKLSQHSILALAGLVAFALAVLIVNPFGVHAAIGSVSNAKGSTPGTNQQAQQPTSGGGQGSLLTGTPSPTGAGASGSGTTGTHHHNHGDGNSTSDY